MKKSSYDIIEELFGKIKKCCDCPWQVECYYRSCMEELPCRKYKKQLIEEIAELQIIKNK